MPPTTRQLDQVSAAGSDTCGLITRRMCAEAWDVAMLAPPVDSDGTSCCPLQATFDETSWCAGPSDASEGAGAKKDASGRGKALLRRPLGRGAAPVLLRGGFSPPLAARGARLAKKI